jgi:predicted MFS family arabinose efflux permease
VGTVSRTVGPAIAGILISTAGTVWAFAINAISFIPVLASLWGLDVLRMRPQVRVTRARGQIRDGFRYARSHPKILSTLILTAIVSVFAWNWHTLLPVYATSEFGGSAGLYGSMVSALSVGSLVAALVSTSMQRADARHLLWSSAAVSVSLLATAVAPTVLLAFIGVFAIGATCTTFNIGAQTRLQINVEDSMTSRVMAMYSVSWIGSRPAGGLIGGWITDASDSRMAFLFGSIAVACALAWTAASRRRRPRPA